MGSCREIVGGLWGELWGAMGRMGRAVGMRWEGVRMRRCAWEGNYGFGAAVGGGF